MQHSRPCWPIRRSTSSTILFEDLSISKSLWKADHHQKGRHEVGKFDHQRWIHQESCEHEHSPRDETRLKHEVAQQRQQGSV